MITFSAFEAEMLGSLTWSYVLNLKTSTPCEFDCWLTLFGFIGVKARFSTELSLF